jgi:riboflavin synthase
MFTGLVEEIGSVKAVSALGNGKRLSISASSILDDLKIDDSVAINGVCQTVVSCDSKSFTVEAIEETIRKTTFKSIKAGDKVNLERALKVSDRLGGHIVQGHVDSVGKIFRIIPETAGIQLWITYPHEFKKYLVTTGSICINGISLTTARIDDDKFMVAIIPHSWKSTNLFLVKVASEVNLEFDILGKYIENMMSSQNQSKSISSLGYYIDQPDL